MLDLKIKQIGCDQEYGNPSGHSMNFTIALFTFVIDYFYYLKQNK